MSSKVMIFGTVSWPYTNKAREAYGDKAIFVDVGSNSAKLEEMLKYSNGRRQVPVIVDGDKVTVGFGGAWGVWFAGGSPVQLVKSKKGINPVRNSSPAIAGLETERGIISDGIKTQIEDYAFLSVIVL